MITYFTKPLIRYIVLLILLVVTKSICIGQDTIEPYRPYVAPVPTLKIDGYYCRDSSSESIVIRLYEDRILMDTVIARGKRSIQYRDNIIEAQKDIIVIGEKLCSTEKDQLKQSERAKRKKWKKTAVGFGALSLLELLMLI